MKALGIDVGGTYLKVALFDGKKMRTSAMPTPKTFREFKKILTEIVAVSGGKSITALGFGIPGQVDREKSRVIRCHNLPYLNGQDFKALARNLGLSSSVGLKLDNDVRCHLNAELKFGGAKKYSSVVMIAIGTGIGGGIAFDGKIYYGQGKAGEIGKMVIDAGQNYESLAAGKFLQKFDAVELRRVAKYTGQACASIFNILDPEAIILSGGVIQRDPQILKMVKNFMAPHLLRSKKIVEAKVVLSGFKEFGGAVGAAWL